MSEHASIRAAVSGGAVGVAGAQEVRIGSQTFISNFYSAAPAPEAAKPNGPIPPCPYPGLAFFGPSDASRFFGRDQATDALVDAVAKRSFTALVGASGSGKSSVVLAGLAPRLETKGGWRSSYFRIGTEPDKNPFAALARALSPMLGDGDVVDRMTRAQKLANSLANGEISLVYVIGQCRAANPGKRILLIADQFEEVFTLVRDETERSLFIDALIAAFPDPAQDSTPDVCLVLTLRADFYNAALRNRPLADRLQDHVANLGPMTRDELREAIVKPAEQLQPSVTFEPGLAGTILDDVERRPGSLPLLQFALREMWGRLKTPLMTRSDYDAIGGVEGALAKRAQAIFDAATDQGRDEANATLFRRLFTRLVTLGESAEDTRRIARRDELDPDAWALAQRLADEDNRLVVTAASSPGKETVEVVHEALIRNWPALVEWVNRDRAFISWRNQLKPRLDEWCTNPIDEGTLLRGGPLAVAEDWVGRRGSELTAEEKDFVARGVALRDEEKQRAQEELRREQARIVELQRQRANLFAALSGTELQRGNLDAALRLASKGVRDDLASQSEAVVGTRSMASMASAVSQAQWRVAFRVGEASANSAAFSPDGSRIVTASSDQTARIWDAATGKEIVVLRGHDDSVISAAFSPDGSRIVTASDDQIVRIWDAATGKEIVVLRGHDNQVISAAFSPDGSRIVTASGDKTARIWDAATGKEIVVLRGHDGLVLSAAFSPDGSRIVTASWDQTARIWDAATGKEIVVLRGHDRFVMSAAFSPDGSRIVTASWDKTARIWDAATGKEIVVLRGHDDRVSSAAFSPDGSRIVTASRDKTARIWDAATGKEIVVRRGHHGAVFSAAFSPDGSRIVTASSDKTVRIWDAATGKEIFVLRGHDDIVISAAFSPDGSHIVTASRDKTARIWDAATGKEIIVLGGHNDGVSSAAFSRDRSRIVAASGDKTARIWDAATGKEIVVLRGHDGLVLSAAFSPDGSRIVTASWDMTARIWDAATGKEFVVLGGHHGTVFSAAFSPDGSRIVTASSDQTARIWDAATGKEIVVLRGHDDSVISAAFSPDGSRIVTASSDKTARIWDAATGKEIVVLRGHDDRVSSAAFSADGSRIVTASDDKTARIWDAATGKEIVVLRGHDDGVSSAAFSPDGSRIVTASDDKTARIWDVHFATMPAKALLEEVCQHRLVGFSTMTRDEMRLAGYSDSEPLINVCAAGAR